MCILLVTRTKKYSIFLSNRDEFLARPTTRADWWPSPNEHILGARDLARPAHGTWLGITRQGRIAVLTNYREETEEGANAAAISRGEIVKEFLICEKPIEEWIQEVLATGVYKNVGGFSLVCAIIKKEVKGYAVVSNRSSLEKGADYVLGVEGHSVVGDTGVAGLSNSLIHDEWPKVELGKQLLKDLTKTDIDDEEEFIEKAFELLSTNSFSVTPTINTLRESIFIPKWATPALPQIPADHTKALPEWASSERPRLYGTREQTVILVSRDNGRVIYTERTLWNEHGEPLGKDEGQTRVEFHIEDWDKSI